MENLTEEISKARINDGYVPLQSKVLGFDNYRKVNHSLMISLTPFSDCIQDVESDEYLTILYSTPEDANKARILAEWERMLGEIQALL